MVQARAKNGGGPAAVLRRTHDDDHVGCLCFVMSGFGLNPQSERENIDEQQHYGHGRQKPGNERALRYSDFNIVE